MDGLNDIPASPGAFAFTEEEVATALAQSMPAQRAAALAKRICKGADASTVLYGDLIGALSALSPEMAERVRAWNAQE